jgi:EAL domain-containing protein (putative c-di-GMP-specific phosphodiesterase class I)/GGDEF domain-containing protein
MLDKDVIEKFSERFRYKDTPWFKGLHEAVTLQKRRMMIASYLAAMMVPFSFLLSDIVLGEKLSLPGYAIPLAILFIMTMLIFLSVPGGKLFKRYCSFVHMSNGTNKPGLFLRLSCSLEDRFSVERAAFLTMCIASAGYFVAAYIPHSRQLAIFIGIVFIPYAFLLNGARRGSFWSIGFIIAVVAVQTLSHIGILPPSNLGLTRYQLIMVGLGAIFTLVLLYLGQKQQERIFGELIRHLVFDRDTGLPNKEAMLKSYPEDSPFLLVIVQIQNFRELTSLFGYDMSERILLSSAEAVDGICSRDGYPCFKLAGHEFGIIIPIDDISDPADYAEKILGVIWFELQSHTIAERSGEVSPVYRIGASVATPHDRSKALAKADIALDLAGRLHRNVFVYNELVDDRRHILKSGVSYKVLLDNLRNNKLKTLYQPIVDTITGETVWYESLLRIRRGDDSLESIYPYLPIARDTGLYHTLTRFVLHNARAALMLTDRDIAVNITLSDIAHPGFMDEALLVCRAVAGCRGKLIFEIVESEELTDIDSCREFIDTIRELGCKIAIDDFGSGYSNFCNILNLSVDIVKIDGLLMRSVETDSNARAMVESIVSFCRKAGKTIVAEYIENENLHRIAREIGVHYCQGYYFGVADELEERCEVG